MILTMKKIAALLLTLPLLAFFTQPVFAEGEAAQTERWVCLQSQHCWEQAAGWEACSPRHQKNGHVARLSAKQGFEPLTGQPTYVVVCIATEDGQICTTGNQQSDIAVYCPAGIEKCEGGKTPFERLQTDLKYKFEGLFGSDGTTTVANPAEWSGPYEWGDSTPQGHMRTWFALNYWDPQVSATGGEGGQQQGTFDFETAEKDCVKIGWDPYGRVFDAGTLEPVPGVSVLLHVKKDDSFIEFDEKAAENQPNSVVNPQNTLEDGQFSYVVKDGTYKLIVPGALTDVAGVDINYTKAYSDIYPSMTGEEIVQAGEIQHRDIPVATLGTNNPPKMMEYMYQTTSDGLIIIEGRTSHPLTQLNVKTAKAMGTDPQNPAPYRTVKTFTADNLGKFRIEVDQTEFEKTAEYTEIFSEVELVKVDLRQPTAKSGLVERIIAWVKGLAGDVQAQSKTTTSIKFEPIPQYIEGYAYDAAGKPIPNATVGVYMKYSGKAYSTHKADATGFFKITSEYLPNFPYTLKYQTATGVAVTTKPSAFLAQNQKYLVQKKIDPYIARDVKNNIAPTASHSSSSSRRAGETGAMSGTGGSSSNAKDQTATQKLASQAVPLILMLVLLVVAAVAAVVVVLKKKSSTSLPPPPAL